MNIKELKEILSKYPEDTEIQAQLWGGYAELKPHDIGLVAMYPPFKRGTVQNGKRVLVIDLEDADKENIFEIREVDYDRETTKGKVG